MIAKERVQVFIFIIRRKTEFIIDNVLCLHTFRFSLILMLASIACFLLSWKTYSNGHKWLPDVFLTIGGGLVTGFTLYILSNIRNSDFELNRKRADFLPIINKKCFEIERISDIYNMYKEKHDIEQGKMIIQTMFDIYKTIMNYYDGLDIDMKCNIDLIDPVDDIDYEYDYFILQVKLWNAYTITELNEIDQKIVQMANQISANIRQYGYTSIRRSDVLNKKSLL